MDLGTFSVSLAVRDLEASRAFYEKFGFTPFFGKPRRAGSSRRTGDVAIGLFQGMFERNILTFNPGCGLERPSPSTTPTDVRELQRELRASGVEFQVTADDSTTGPAKSFIAGRPGREPGPGRPARLRDAGDPGRMSMPGVDVRPIVEPVEWRRRDAGPVARVTARSGEPLMSDKPFDPTVRPSRGPLVWVGGLAIVGVIALAVAFGSGALESGGAGAPGPIAANPTPTEPPAPTADPAASGKSPASSGNPAAGGGMASCLVYDPANLPTFDPAAADLAFAPVFRYSTISAADHSPRPSLRWPVRPGAYQCSPKSPPFRFSSVFAAPNTFVAVWHAPQWPRPSTR